jgi:hypothetical protein
MNFYDRPLPERLSQGDLLYPIPFAPIRIDKAQIVVNGTSTKTVDLSETSEQLTGHVIAPYALSWGIVLNQGCDLEPERKLPILVARVIPCTALYAESKFATPQKAEEFLRNRFNNAGQQPRHFYLPAVSGESNVFPRSLAVLCEIQTFPAENLRNLIEIRKLSLSYDAVCMLQEKIWYCFGRLAGREDLIYTEDEWNCKPQASKAEPPKVITTIAEHPSETVRSNVFTKIVWKKLKSLFKKT